MRPRYQFTNERTASLINRRDFLKFCGLVAGALSLGTGFAPRIAEALTSADRPPVLWLHFSECTGCTESLLRSSGPFMDELLFDIISLEYHETLMAAAGSTVEDLLAAASIQYAGEFFCVVEGAIPTADGGVYGTIGGRTMLSIAEEILPRAKAIIATGTCSSFGGLAAAAPNPTGAMGVKEALPSLGVPVVNLPGCPPNPVNFVAVLANYLLAGSLPSLDSQSRPNFAYGKTNHSLCPYRSDNSRCLKKQGCKGPSTHSNCPNIKFNQETSFPMQAGHPCIGCTEPDFWDVFSPFYG